jgi:hypothetical protein
MISALREAFNRDFRPDTYQIFLETLNARVGVPVGFRVSETPCFLPGALLGQMADYGRELVLQLVDNPEYRRASDVTVPPAYHVANESPRPMFLQVDFGLIRTDAGELEHYIDSYRLSADLGVYLGGLDAKTYQQALHDVIVSGHDPENVILLELRPDKQKTLCDFALARRDLGLAVVDILSLKKRGSRLYYEKEGREVPVERIYNRCIADELERERVELPFDLTEPLDVEWAGHPNWYYRISKFSIPWLRHPCVPQTTLLDRSTRVPADNENYLLKPLYSFAGRGIKFAPTQADVDSIPIDQRHHYMLQERLRFEPVIDTPHGKTQAEIRIMYVWPEGKELIFVMPLLRMGRGLMMGVDHNRDLEWVGASAALWV